MCPEAMVRRLSRIRCWGYLALLIGSWPAGHCVRANPLTAADLIAGRASAPVANAAFFPPANALPAPRLAGVLRIRRTSLQTEPLLDKPVIDGRDARIFPGITLELLSVGDRLVPAQIGEMLKETSPSEVPSYWQVIPQMGRIWREAGDGGWFRAALPLMLVNDTENHAHQGLATFLYRGNRITRLKLQFVQQTAPYLLRHFVAWGSAPAEFVASPPGASAELESKAKAEIASRLPAHPWSDLVKSAAAGALDGFGGPLYPKWRVEAALVQDGVLFYQESATAFGPYPYPLEMRFGVRSVMKSVGAPLSLLRLAQVYGPWVFNLTIGTYVHGLDPKWNRIRFVDAANMASGFGGTGTLKTNPNDIFDGYLDGDYDAWYLAHSYADKLARINATLRPYPWDPGTVVRYRDQDFFLLGAAIDGFLKSMRGPDADIWQMLETEVFAPIGILHAPAVRTREPNGKLGLVWFNAGYYPTLDDLAKIAMLYQSQGEHAGQQILHRQLTRDLLTARNALQKSGDASIAPHDAVAPFDAPNPDAMAEFYGLGFHFVPYVTASTHRVLLLPTMVGSGDNQITLYPNGLVSIVIAKVAQVPAGEKAKSDDGPETDRAVERLKPF
jgi:CubicO group peptidase (beta-lactamase class C family)